MSALLEGLFNGISIGSVLLLAALGLAIVFGLMGVINLAHGELMMLGAYSTFVVQNVFKGFGSPLFDTYVLFALPIAFLVSGLAGLLLERGVIRFLYGRPLETLLATWGVSLILQQFVRSVNGLFLQVLYNPSASTVSQKPPFSPITLVHKIQSWDKILALKLCLY